MDPTPSNLDGKRMPLKQRQRAPDPSTEAAFTSSMV